MLDPLTVLGVIANVTQFIDFTIKMFTNNCNIYHSAGGSLAEDDDLNIVTRDISVLSRKLRESLAMTDTSTGLTADEQVIYNLCKNSQKLWRISKAGVSPEGFGAFDKR